MPPSAFSFLCLMQLLVHVVASAALINPAGLNRTNFCSCFNEVLNNTRSIANGLQGMHVTVGIQYGSSEYLMNVSYGTGQPHGGPTPGYLFALQNAIASHGQFTFKYVLLPPAGPTESFNQLILKMVPHIDLFAGDIFADNALRRQLGIGFTQQVVDASLILVTNQAITELAFDPAHIFMPFTGGLWGLVCLVVVFNGALSWYLERPEHRGKSRSLYRSVLLAMSAITDGGGMEPEKSAAMILNVGFLAFKIFITCFYIAGLAEFLSSEQVVTSPVHSITDANNHNVKVCVEAGAFAQSVLQSDYPGVHQVPLPLESLLSSVGSACVAAVVPQYYWDFQQGQQVTDSKCNLVVVGPVIMPVTGAWPYYVDFASHCTSFVETVVSEILVGMQASGELSNLYQAAISGHSDSHCKSGDSPEALFQPLTLNAMSGVLLLWAGTCALCLVLMAEKALRDSRVVRYPEPPPLIRQMSSKKINRKKSSNSLQSLDIAAPAEN